MQVKLQLLLAFMLLKASVLLAQTGRSVPSAQFHYESAVYLKSLDKVFTVSSDDQGLNAAGNTLSIVSPIWARAEQSFQAGYNPRQLCASPDETQLYFLADGPALLKQFNVNSKTIVQETPLPTKQYFYSLRASPFSANRLVAFSVTNDSAFVYLIQQGVFSPQKLAFWNPERMQGMDFIDDNTIIAWSSTTIFWIKLNANGLAVEKSFPDFSFAFDEKGFLANGKLITEKGRVFNLSQTEPFEEQRLPLSPYLINLAWAPNLDYFYALEPTNAALKLSFSRYKKSDLSLEKKWIVDYAVSPFGLYSVDEKMVITGPERLFFKGETYTHIAWNCIPIIKAPLLSPRGNILHCNSDSLFLKTDRQDISEIIWTNASKGASVFVSENGIYAAKYTDSLGCQTNFSSPTSVTFISAPAAFSINFRDYGEVDTARICIGSKTTLSARSWDYVKRWLWSNGDTTQNITVAPGTYRYKAIAPDGCASGWSNPVVVLNRNDTIPPIPSIKTLNGADNFCIGDKIILETTPGYKYYYWNGLFNTSHRYEHPTFGNSNYNTSINVRYGNVFNCLSEVSANLLFKINAPPSKPEIKIQGDKITSNLQGIHQWYLNGQLLEGFTGNSIPLKGGGFYAAKFVSNNCLSDFSNLVPVSGKTTSLYEPTAGVLNIQPNPVLDQLTLSWDTNLGKPLLLRILTLNGEQIQLQKINLISTQHLRVPVSDFAKGMYLLELQTEGGRLLGKFIKL